MENLAETGANLLIPQEPHRIAQGSVQTRLKPGRKPSYPGKQKRQVWLDPDLDDRMWTVIKRAPLTPFVNEAIRYYLEALEAGRTTRPGR